MLWCEDCSKSWNPTSMGGGCECPTCGTVIAAHAPVGLPWHFKVILFGLSGYLVYRVYWLAIWLPKHI